MREYQSVVDGINWLTINTQIDINTAYNLFSQFDSNPSQGHLDARKYVIWYLKHTSFHGIWFRQAENCLKSSITIPEHLKGEELMILTDSNCGPKESSKLKPNKKRTATMEILISIQGLLSNIWRDGREGLFTRSSPRQEREQKLMYRRNQIYWWWNLGNLVPKTFDIMTIKSTGHEFSHSITQQLPRKHWLDWNCRQTTKETVAWKSFQILNLQSMSIKGSRNSLDTRIYKFCLYF